MKIERVEIRTDVAAAGGTHQANIPRNDLLTATLVEDLDGKREFNIKVARDSGAWASIQNKRVFRVIYTDGDIDEFRIEKPAEGRARSGAERATVKAHGIFMDLANGVVSRDETNGVVTMFYTLLALSRTDLITLIVAAAPSHFSVGTITDGTTKVGTFTFEYDSPLKALQELAVLENLELAVRRNGDTDYKVDLVTAVGSAATQAEFRYRKQLKGVGRELDSSEMANRIYPAGGGDDAIRLGVAEATWEILAVTATTLDLDGDPIYEDDVLNGMYLEHPDGTTRQQITDSAITNQRITVGSAHGLSTGELVKFRANTSGKHLPYVESLLQQATYGLQHGTIAESDLPFVDNPILNAAFSDWSGGNPVSWSDVGAPTTTEETSALYTKIGGSAAKVVAAADEGIVSAAVTLAPVDPSIYFAAFVQLQIESGEVEFFLTHSTEGRFPVAGAQKVAASSEHDKFIQLSIETGEWPAGTVTLSIVARNGAATFYVDAAQITNTAENQPFFEGSAARVLWQRALVALGARDTPVTSYKIDADDVFAIDPVNFPHDELTLGGTVLVEDEILALQVQTRVLQLKRDLLESQTLAIGLSNLRDDITDILTRRRRRTRQAAEPRASAAGIESFVVSHQDDGTVVLQFFGALGARSFRYIADSDVMPTFAEVIATAGDGINSNTVDGTEVVVTEFRNSPSNPKLGANQRCFVRVVAYPILSAGGVPGTTTTGVIGPTNFWNAEILSTGVNQEGDATAGDGEVTRSWTVDHRAVELRVYRRLGAWPTLSGVDPDTNKDPDPAYYRGTINAEDNWAYKDGGYSGSDVVYDVVVAMDINGGKGEMEGDSYTVINTSTPDPQFATATREQADAGTNCSGDKRSVKLDWTYTGSVTASHQVRIQRQVDGGVIVDLTTITDPSATFTYTDNEAPMYGGGSQARSCDYILKLEEDTGPVVIDERRLDETHTGPEWNLCETPE